ncbi:transglycosylase domain-containing protein [Tessaracoccus flavus]|uniref:Penicillin-binding protein n=1 Tax=Tessaracoccus flavus TaxID=1610493 RepID=A0A1Q2CHN2_9ACTN|nr:transglycosylase domain-containing protein [Tessaracoccus flavus]AQP45629.1 penicillin-binding protein [Tessaracoccus flavus]SDY76860.1 Membrane carboxypeptidase (penicillin-binding protein) [Tessaracoccus flavus]
MAKAKRRAKSRAREIWGRLGIGALVVFLLGSLAGLGTFLFLYATTDLPDPNSDFTTNTTFLYYEDGRNQLGSLAVQNRVTIPYAEMPQLMKDAVVAAENRTFWEDPGFSVSGIMRSVYSIATGGELQGGSTITQQYIKILYLDSGQRLSRKVNELILATKMGRELPKEEILEGYLNTIYFGRGAYGIQAAAKSYFLKDAKDLTVEESAALAAILNNPAGFNPSGGPEKLEKLLGRYQYVLRGMLEMGAITQAEFDRAQPALPTFPEVPINNRYGGPKGFLISMVEDELTELAGLTEGEIQGGGLKVVTTLNKTMQSAATTTAQKYTAQAAADAEGSPDPADLHVAIASVDTDTGALLSLYGGPDYVENSRNWATTPRPAASTFKTFATIAGLRNGFSLDSVFNGDTFTPRGDTRTVRNEFSNQYGPVTLRRATAESINTAFVDMTEQIPDGVNEVIRAANDAGAPTGSNWEAQGNRISLGAAEVSPVNMAKSYATLANGGRRNETHIVKQVIDRNGIVVYEAASADEETIDRNVAANVTDSLTSVVTEGTGRRASELGRPVAGKTGTNGVEDTITSAWFVGYTKQISTAVMYVAGDAGTADLEDYKRPQDPTFFGSSYPLMTWVEYMMQATEGMPIEEFDEPIEIEPERGETLTPSPSPPPSPSESPSEEPSPSPSPSPTPSETPSEEPTETPTPTPTPTEEPEPTEPPEPTEAPEPTLAPSPTAVPTPTATATQVVEPPNARPTASATVEE